MNLVSVFISLMAVYGVSYVIPEDYTQTLKYISLGIIIPYTISLLMQFFTLKKLSMLAEWFIMYAVLCIYGFIFNTYIFVFCLGTILAISVGIVTGTKVVLVYPFKQIKLTTLLSPYITLALIESVIIWNIILLPFNTIQYQVWLVTGVLLFILSAMHIDFFIRLNNLIKYLFKIDVSEIEKAHRSNTIKILLKEISPLWTRNKAVINLQSLADNTWLSNEPKVIQKEWIFKDSEILFFWQKNIQNRAYAPVFKDTVGELLTFLDKYGHCPSVVKEQSKKFGQYGYADEQTSFDILYKQTLINHTLQVCDLILSDDKMLGGINKEKMLLTALGHDIGKAASFNNIEGYKTGDHPNTSVMLIETKFEYFDKLNYANEVMKMIKNHHGTPSVSTPLLQEFKEYDSKARRMYLKEYFKNLDQEKQEKKTVSKESHKQITADKELISVDNGTMTSPHMSERVTLSTTTSATEPQQTNNEDSSIFLPDFAQVPSIPAPVSNNTKQVSSSGSSELEKLSTNDSLYMDLASLGKSPDYYAISKFFNINDFLKIVSKNLNIIDNGRFAYITVNGDMVLCYTASVIVEIKKAARLNKVQGINNLEDKEIGMSFTEYCRKLGILHTDWIQEGYFQGNFSLTDINGEVIKTGRYIPLRIDALSEYGTYADYESRKQGILENIVNAKVATKEEMYQ